MTDLTLTGLRVVLEVARTGSFSATAERLGYTQSAVSRHLKDDAQTGQRQIRHWVSLLKV